MDTDTAGPSTIIVQSCQVQAAVGLVERDVGIRYMMYTCRFSCIYIYIISHKMRVFLRYGECTYTCTDAWGNDGERVVQFAAPLLFAFAYLSHEE